MFLMLNAMLLLAVLHRIPAAHLITLGPESSIEEQLQYAKRHWPKDFFVAVLTIESEPECSKHRGSRVTYCRADIAIERMIWNPSLQERRNHYRLHYWYPREEKSQP